MASVHRPVTASQVLLRQSVATRHALPAVVSSVTYGENVNAVSDAALYPPR